jgi:hypothetical protein
VEGLSHEHLPDLAKATQPAIPLDEVTTAKPVTEASAQVSKLVKSKKAPE